MNGFNHRPNLLEQSQPLRKGRRIDAIRLPAQLIEATRVAQKLGHDKQRPLLLQNRDPIDQRFGTALGRFRLDHYV